MTWDKSTPMASFLILEFQLLGAKIDQETTQLLMTSTRAA
jgi:hypothetical protein